MSAADSEPPVAAAAPEEVSEGGSAVGSAVQGTAERDALAVLIAHPTTRLTSARGLRPEGCTRCTWALEAADAVLAAGYRQVIDNDETVERVARTLAADALDRYVGDPSVVSWDEATEETRVELRASARAALQALRGGGAA